MGEKVLSSLVIKELLYLILGQKSGRTNYTLIKLPMCLLSENEIIIKDMALMKSHLESQKQANQQNDIPLI